MFWGLRPSDSPTGLHQRCGHSHELALRYDYHPFYDFNIRELAGRAPSRSTGREYGDGDRTLQQVSRTLDIVLVLLTATIVGSVVAQFWFFTVMSVSILFSAGV